MESTLLSLFKESGSIAFISSLIVNVIISILGFVPSDFLTAANITFFGFYRGFLISFIGESLGAIVSFVLYRKGVKSIKPDLLQKSKYLVKLTTTKGMDSFLLIMMLRTLPFVPSGIVNLAAALSKTNLLIFSVASTLGKLPALIIEAYSVKQIIEWDFGGKILLLVFSLSLFIILLKRKKRKKGC
jgi:uncharacterized membrane protein YdjX (TVP38/TMEM64 family)